MSGVVFINPPSPFLLNDRGAPPLGILTLAALLRERGLAVQVWDMTGDTSLAAHFGQAGDRFIAEANATLPPWIADQPDDTMFGITATSAQYESARNVLLALKWVNPHWRVIIGGPHVSALPQAALADGFDAVFDGEADLGLMEWVQQGGTFRGIIRCQAPRALDMLPFPARDLVDLNSYCANLTVGAGMSTTMAHSRGCPYQCAYCVRTLGDAARVLRMRAVGSILEECHALDLTYGLRRFVAVDDLWGVPRRWLQQFCQAFEGEGYHFRVNMRANTLHVDLLPAMKRAGIDVISFGFESGDERVLQAISKNNLELNTRAVEACHEAGIAVKAYLIFGFAEDDAASVEATKRWIEEARPDAAQMSWLVPLPGTPLYADAIAKGWQPAYHELYHLGKDRRGSMLRLPWQTEETPALYEDLCQWIEAFYQRPPPAIDCPVALTSEEV